MGAIYTDIVVTCLLCLDRDNTRFGDEDEFSDEDDIVVGIQYIQKVKTALSLCPTIQVLIFIL